MNKFDELAKGLAQSVTRRQTLKKFGVGLVGMALAGRVMAQTFTVLHTFTATDPYNYINSDGANPVAGLILSGNTLYGTASDGGSSGNGTVFAVNTDGTGFTNLHDFAGYPGEGATPDAGLILSGNILYGTADFGGNSDNGTVFAINTDGTGFTNLHSFTATPNSDGALPIGLVLSGNALYGITSHGGAVGFGTVFKLNTDGTGYTVLWNTGSIAGLTLSGSTLYGTTIGFGSSGMVFAINTDGTGFTNLHSFTALDQTYMTNSDGAYPRAGVILSGNTLYGTAENGGSSGNGTVFAVNTDGTGFTNLHSFSTDRTNSFGIYTNSDGALPLAGLILSGNTLYGTAKEGGSSGNGTVFAVNTDGTGFRNLHSFTATPYFGYPNSDGANPTAGLILSGNTLYGTTLDGGSSGSGTIFSISLPVPPPQLSITPSRTNVILTWPTNYAGFDYTGYTLQSTTNLVPPTVWTTNSILPVVVNGRNTVTNPISGTQQFFRLIGN